MRRIRASVTLFRYSRNSKTKKTRREARGTGVFVMRWCANHLAVKRNGTKRVNLPPAKCYRQDRFVIISAFESVERNK